MTGFAQTLQHRVSVQVPSGGVDDSDDCGQPTIDWTEMAALWADIRVAGGLETIKAGAEMSVVKASIRVRYRSDIDASMRVVHGTTIYAIKAVLPDLVGRRYVDLVCEVIR